MASSVDAAGEPIPTSAVLTASSKHIAWRCQPENIAFLKCKKKDPNPEKCLDKGRQVTRCVLGLLKDLHQRCTKEMDAYVGCNLIGTVLLLTHNFTGRATSFLGREVKTNFQHVDKVSNLMLKEDEQRPGFAVTTYLEFGSERVPILKSFSDLYKLQKACGT